MDMPVDENRPMLGNRSAPQVGEDSDDGVRRAGGDDPRRYDAQILIDRVVQDNDMSGYNHNATSSQPVNGGRENEMRMAQMDKQSKAKGTINPDGTYSY